MNIVIWCVLIACCRTTFGAPPQELQPVKQLQNCLDDDNSVTCLKERTLKVLNEIIESDEEISLFGIVNVAKDVGYKPEEPEEDLPQDSTKRSIALNDLLYRKVQEFFKSRSVKFDLASAFEGRRKGGIGGGGGKKGNMMLIMGALVMAGVIGQLFMGKIAFMAGAALLMAKLALLLSALAGFKKLSGGGGGGGGETPHVVYASNGDSGYGGHTHGGWHRSMTFEEDPQNIPYKAYVPIHENANPY